MRSPITLRRIQSQMGTRYTPDTVRIAYAAIQEVVDSSPITLDELRMFLMSELGVSQIVPEVCPPAEDIYFGNIYDFVSWYSVHQMEFTEQQRVALDTLLATRNGIESGCACRRASREHLAHSYFGQFWANNCKTDLLETISKITGSARVSIGNICVYPSLD